MKLRRQGTDDPPRECGYACRVGSARRYLLVLGLLGVAIAGCRGDEETAKELQQESIADELRAFDATLISERETRAAGSSVERAFLRYWSDVQYQAWADAAQTYDAALLADVGAASVIEALKSQATHFRSAKPRNITVKRSQGGRRTVRYFVKNPGGKVEPRSMVWERDGRRWLIFYDPFLDEALRASATTLTQDSTSPGAEGLSRRARVAGTGASQRQSRSLGRRLSKSQAAAEPRPAQPPSP